MTNQPFIILDKRTSLGSQRLWKNYLHWYLKAQTIYDIHSPFVFPLAKLFLQLKNGANEKNHLLLVDFLQQGAELYYFKEKDLTDQNNQLALRINKNADVLIYVENFRTVIEPNSLKTNFPFRKSVLIEGANQLLYWIKAEEGEYLHIPLVSYKWKFWRAGVF